MKRLLATIAVVLAVAVPFSAANAQDEERATALEQCLLESSGVEESALFKNLLKAMIDEDVDQTRTFLFAILDRMEDVAINECGAPDDITEQAWARNVPGNYIQAMVEGIFATALAGLAEL